MYLRRLIKKDSLNYVNWYNLFWFIMQYHVFVEYLVILIFIVIYLLIVKSPIIKYILKYVSVFYTLFIINLYLYYISKDIHEPK
jgi:hypothetical protein